ncbi:MAG: anaerobic ribonucleoside-triphosphate reductase activating protein [Bacilli bacterium]|jgi:pyruvate formate lyase activating enzyme
MIYGLNPNSLVDYPGELSFVIFLGGCNFRCPYCHNKDIVNKTNDVYEEEDVLEELKKRFGFIKTVTITGGEPTIYGDKLVDLIASIKDLGYLVKLDTNGTNPNVIKTLIDKKLIDYIAMDIKNTFDQYESTVGVPVNIDNIKESIRLIEASNINYEFRTTINKEMHSEEAILEITSYVSNNSKLVLQPYRYNSEQLVNIPYTPYDEEELMEFKKNYNVSVRI